MKFTGRWTIEDGTLVAGKEPVGSPFGAYLVTDESFADFELEFEVWPTWSMDTGVVVRAAPHGGIGWQCLVDYRDEGGIAGFFGNGLGGAHCYPFFVMGRRNARGEVVGIDVHRARDANRGPLTHAADPEQFQRIWRWNDWNRFRLRCEGRRPRFTTWVNDLKIAELDTAALIWPGYNALTVAERLGPSGHVALEIHDASPSGKRELWGHGAVCRWRNLFLTAL